VTAPRIAPGARRDIGTVNWAMIAAGARVAKAPGMPKLFTTMARHSALFRAWLFFAGRLMPRGRLPRRETELVILRTAALNHCDYELDHHRRLGARAGLSESEITRAIDPASSGWSERDAALLDAANQLSAERDLDDPTWQRLRNHLTEPEAIEFLLLTGHYSMLATFINTLRIPLDAGD
jgi:AhpD family alkylhydroperoxidase